MGENFRPEAEPQFRLSHAEVCSWADNILVKCGGDALESDPEPRQAIKFADDIKRELSKSGLERNEIIAEAVSAIDLDSIYSRVRERNEEGLAELSEGLSFYGTVQAVVRNSEDRDEVIDVRGIVLMEPDSYRVSLVDGGGNIYDYSKMRALLVPKEGEDE